MPGQTGCKTSRAANALACGADPKPACWRAGHRLWRRKTMARTAPVIPVCIAGRTATSRIRNCRRHAMFGGERPSGQGLGEHCGARAKNWRPKLLLSLYDEDWKFWLGRLDPQTIKLKVLKSLIVIIFSLVLGYFFGIPMWYQTLV